MKRNDSLAIAAIGDGMLSREVEKQFRAALLRRTLSRYKKRLDHVKPAGLGKCAVKS